MSVEVFWWFISRTTNCILIVCLIVCYEENYCLFPLSIIFQKKMAEPFMDDIVVRAFVCHIVKASLSWKSYHVVIYTQSWNLYSLEEVRKFKLLNKLNPTVCPLVLWKKNLLGTFCFPVIIRFSLIRCHSTIFNIEIFIIRIISIYMFTPGPRCGRHLNKN